MIRTAISPAVDDLIKDAYLGQKILWTINRLNLTYQVLVT